MNSEIEQFAAGPGPVAGAVRSWFRGSTLNGVKVPLGELVDELERQAHTKKDFVVDARNMAMNIRDGKPFLAFASPEGDELEFGIRPIAHGQIADKCGIPKRYYDRMQEEAPMLLGTNVNNWLPQKDARMVRTLDGDARAVLSDKFRTLDNSDLFFAAAATFKEVGAQIVRADLSESRFYIKAINPNFEAPIKHGDTLVGGVTVSNSEVGHGTMKVEQFGLRVECMNGMIGESVFKKIHLGEKMEVGLYQADTIAATVNAIWKQTRDHILAAFDQHHVVDWADTLAGTMKVDLPTATQLATGSWKGLDVSAEEKDDILAHLLGDGEGHTQFGFIQAVTASARDLDNADRKADLERLGFTLTHQSEEQFERTMTQAVVAPSRRAKA